MTTWFVYMLRCADDSFYIGVTTERTRRLAEHNGLGKSNAGAKYTKTRRPVDMVYTREYPSRSTAQQQEAALKRLSHTQKAQLAMGITPNPLLSVE